MFAITPRLLLRPGWTEDAAALTAALGEPAVARNLARVPHPYELGHARDFLSQASTPLRPRFLIFLREGCTLVGGIGLHGERVAELGYWIGRRFWHRGYATEAAQAVLAIADESLRLDRVVSSHAVDNPASGRVLTKLGFSPAGEARLHSVARGEEMPVRLFSRDRVVAYMGQALAA